jgi:type II secretory pathway pseudopilin PulG
MALESTVDRTTVDGPGETLVELLITLVILSTAVIALVTGIGAAIKMSDVHRKQATAGAYLRDYADGIENYIAGNATTATGYTPCTTGMLPNSTYQTPPSFTFTDTAHYQYTVTGIAYWDTSTSPASWNTSGCPSNGDSGVQRVSLSVASKDVGSARATETLDIVIREPCRPGISFPLDLPCT